MLRAGPKQSKRCALDEDSAPGEIVEFPLPYSLSDVGPRIKKGGRRDRIELGYCDGGVDVQEAKEQVLRLWALLLRSRRTPEIA